jgi:hypothetical protein
MKTGVLVLLAMLCVGVFAEEATYQGRTAKEWAALLNDKDKPTRLHAMTAVLAIGKDADTNEIMPKVLPLLDDPDPYVCAKAARWVSLVNQDPRALKAAKRTYAIGIKPDRRGLEIILDSLETFGQMGWAAKDMLPILESRFEKLRNLESAISSKDPSEETKVTKRVIDAIRNAKPTDEAK